MGARLVRDQKVVGSNPTAPTDAGTGAFGSTGALGASGSGFNSLVPDWVNCGYEDDDLWIASDDLFTPLLFCERHCDDGVSLALSCVVFVLLAGCISVTTSR